MKTNNTKQLKGLTITVLFLLFLCFYQCKKDEPGGGETVTNFPLKTGNTWLYYTISQAHDTNGVLVYQYNYYSKWQALKDTLINGEVAVKIHFSDSTAQNGVTHETNGYYTQLASGLYGIASDSLNTSQMLKTNIPSSSFLLAAFSQQTFNKTGGIYYPDSALYILKYPIKINDAWKSNEYGKTFKVMRKYISKEDITTTAGKFDCTKIERTDETASNHPQVFFYFGSKGLIKETLYDTFYDSKGNISFFTETTELISTNF